MGVPYTQPMVGWLPDTRTRVQFWDLTLDWKRLAYQLVRAVGVNFARYRALPAKRAEPSQ